ncbi:MAG: HAD family hydrolase [Clostridia bacterium]|nr:HAD family hydrolase [Clostridia bacterium]
MLHSRLSDFKKKKNFLICIDSDGTAMDVMNIKHKKCFGPCFVKEWQLEDFEGEALKLWNNINLYERTRGNNRFLTLYMALCEVDKRFKKIDGLPELKKWLDNTKSLSNQSLINAIEDGGGEILRKTLNWSQSVNVSTALLTYDDKKPFDGVRECLINAVKQVDVAIVSSAGYAIIEEEWRYHDLIRFVNVLATQEDGTKKVCLEQLAQKGYDKDKILMIGDALSDMDAAKQAGTLFYPMIIDGESQSWQELKDKYLQQFVEGKYKDSQPALETQFENYFN